uniref:Uncharacterized protein n=1 Tax=Brassica oleracea var. oleracea TaxID=109376 RepID=A0A0D3DBL9_BRAOL
MEETSQDVQVHPNQMDARGKDKDACEIVRLVRRMRMHVRLRFLHHPSQVWHDPRQVWHDPSQVWHDLSQVWHDPEAPIGTHAGRLGQSDRYGRMNEPRSNCSERPDLHAGWLQWTDPRTRAHQSRPSTIKEDLIENIWAKFGHLLNNYNV